MLNRLAKLRSAYSSNDAPTHLALIEFWVVHGPLSNEPGSGWCYEGAEQGFAASARVVHELNDAEITGQLVWRDAPVCPEPGTQQ